MRVPSRVVEVRDRRGGNRGAESRVPADRRRRPLLRVTAAVATCAGRPGAKPSTRYLLHDYCNTHVSTLLQQFCCYTADNVQKKPEAAHWALARCAENCASIYLFILDPSHNHCRRKPKETRNVSIAKRSRSASCPSDRIRQQK